MMTEKLTLPTIHENEQTPLVEQLLGIITKQGQQIDILIEEVRRLKGHKGKPKLKPSKLKESEKSQGKNNQSSNKLSTTTKRIKSPPHRTEIIKAQGIPADARFKGYRHYHVQELCIATEKILYQLERWQLSDGSYVVATLPQEKGTSHFGPHLKAYVLHQHHHQGVTQPLLLAQLREWHVEISSGQLSRLLVESQSTFHKEKAEILSAGLSTASYIHVDDTGARHAGNNGYCTHIGNELFAWFKSTSSKSRINFLELLRQDHTDYCLTHESYAYMKRYSVTAGIIQALKPYRGKIFTDKTSFERCLKYLKITHKHYSRLVTEAALIGSVLMHGFCKNTVIMSDDAGQFNIFQHALCWIHAERGIHALIPSSEKQATLIEWARTEVWRLYHQLLDYKKAPKKKLKLEIKKQFRTFCSTKTDYATLNLVLKRLYANREELLLALERPEIPLHNNLSERDIREYVKRRKISGSTRSEEGRQCRDTFASLKKTAGKLKIAFWDYLLDRLTGQQRIAPLADLITQAAALNNGLAPGF